jgi:hypothetical protein
MIRPPSVYHNGSRHFTIVMRPACTVARWLGVSLLAACTSSGTDVGRSTTDSTSSQQRLITEARLVGSWEGTGDKTIGFVSETGCFRINWKTRDEPAANGTFRLTVRSAISGRPIQVIADHRGNGSGTVDFKDDPRMYDFLVDSAGLSWSFTVQEIYDVEAVSKVKSKK